MGARDSYKIHTEVRFLQGLLCRSQVSSHNRSGLMATGTQEHCRRGKQGSAGLGGLQAAGHVLPLATSGARTLGAAGKAHLSLSQENAGSSPAGFTPRTVGAAGKLVRFSP